MTKPQKKEQPSGERAGGREPESTGSESLRMSMSKEREPSVKRLAPASARVLFRDVGAPAGMYWEEPLIGWAVISPGPRDLAPVILDSHAVPVDLWTFLAGRTRELEYTIVLPGEEIPDSWAPEWQI